MHMDDVAKVLATLKAKVNEFELDMSTLKTRKDVYLEVIGMIESQVDKSISWEKRKKQILEHLESGTYKLDGTHPRRPGTRPESLQNIRRAYKESKNENG